MAQRSHLSPMGLSAQLRTFSPKTPAVAPANFGIIGGYVGFGGILALLFAFGGLLWLTT